MSWLCLLKQAQISARRILPSRRWVRSRMTMRAPGVAEWATAAMRRTCLDTQYALRGAFRACGVAATAGGLAPCKSFVATSYASSSSRRPIGTTMPSRWPRMPWLPACLPRPRLYDLNHSRFFTSGSEPRRDSSSSMWGLRHTSRMFFEICTERTGTSQQVKAKAMN